MSDKNEAVEVELLAPQASIKIEVDKGDLMAITVYEQERRLEEAKSQLDEKLKVTQKELTKVETAIVKMVSAAGAEKFDKEFHDSLKSIKAFGFQVSGELSSQLWELKDAEEADKSKIQVTLTLTTLRYSYSNDSIMAVKEMPISTDIKDMIAKRDKLREEVSDIQTKMMKVRKAQDNMGKLERGARARLAMMNLEQTESGRKALAQLKDAAGMPGSLLLGNGKDA